MLTAKQQRFVEEYLVDLNATQAAIRAGYSRRGAEVTASKLLRNAKVAADVQSKKNERSERVEVTQDDVLLGLLAEARFKGAGCSHSARVAAWSWIGKHLGMAIDKHEHSVSGSLSHITEVVVKTREEASALLAQQEAANAANRR